MIVSRPSPNVASPTLKGLISGCLKSSLIAVRVRGLPAVPLARSFVRDEAAQVAQRVPNAEAIVVARGLLQEGLALFAGFVGAVRLLVEQAEVVVLVCEV